MRGREEDDFPVAGPWDCEFSSGSAALIEQLLCAGMGVLSTFGSFFMARGLFLLTGMGVLRFPIANLLARMGVLRGIALKPPQIMLK